MKGPRSLRTREQEQGADAAILLPRTQNPESGARGQKTIKVKGETVTSWQRSRWVKDVSQLPSQLPDLAQITCKLDFAKRN